MAILNSLNLDQNTVVMFSICPSGKDYEGADLPLTVSTEGAATQRFRELRDPAVFEENGKIYLLYTVAAESGIAIGELKIK